ncbi:MAG TPA: tetratricopeptide repeat protein [Actinomycetota bacterium]|nr:tetratricopeptide repeat protein [Actinomycetota bacterium]
MAVESERAGLVVTLFGPPRAERDGRPIEVDTRKAVALLAYLALSDGSHRRDRLAGLLWPEYDETHARAALRRTLSVLNKALGGSWLAIDRTTVGLERARLWLDVAEFRDLRERPALHGHERGDLCAGCVEALRRAAALQRDDFLAGFALRDSPEFDDWQSWQTETLRRELASVLDDLVRAHGAGGRLEEAIRVARRRLLLDPLSEPTHRELMRLFAWSGERGAALAQYRDCVSILDRELGVAPLAETAELYDAIRTDRLEPPVPPAPKETAWEGAARRAPPVPSVPLVGRDAELSAAVKAYDERARAGVLLVVEGEAGIGKTRLAQEFCAAVARRGAVVAWASGREGESHLAFGVVAELLRSCTTSERAQAALADVGPSRVAEAARLLPELARIHGQAPPEIEGPGAQARMLEGLSEVIRASVAGDAPGVVVVDDLQWADPSSVEAVGYLVRRLAGRPLCVVALWRSEEVAPNHPLAGLAADAARRGEALVLAPARLSRADVAALARSAAPGERDADVLADRLFTESEGSPLFLVEYLAALGAGERVGGLPGGLRALVESRVRAVDEGARQLLGAAAVLGRSFDYETLRETAGRDDDETVGSLETLVARGLVRQAARDGERDEVGFDFTHDKIRSFVYEDMGAPRRRLLHRRAAAALARPGRAAASERSLHALVARHLELAGDTAGAAARHRHAGQDAASVLAHAEALAHFEAALALEGGDAGDLHEAIGDVHTLQGDYGPALTSFETAAARADEKTLARLEHKLGNVHHRRGNWLAADSHYEAALEKAGADDVLRARVLADRSLTAHRRRDTPTAHAHARAALAVAEATGDDRALAQAHNVLGSIAAHLGDADAARRHLERSLELGESSGDRGAQVAALNNLGLVLRRTGDATQALELTERALTLSEQTGDRHHRAALHNNVADILHDLGRAEDAMTHLKQAVALFSDIGGDELEPEIWKLTQW